MTLNCDVCSKSWQSTPASKHCAIFNLLEAQTLLHWNYSAWRANDDQAVPTDEVNTQ